MIAVLDASVIIKWFIPDPGKEPHHDRALAILKAVREGTIEPLLPPHCLAEVTAVLARLTPDLVNDAVDLLDAMEFAAVDEPGICKRAAALASDLKQHVFDTLYHAIALEHSAPLITADTRYLNKARHLGQILHLADWAD